MIQDQPSPTGSTFGPVITTLRVGETSHLHVEHGRELCRVLVQYCERLALGVESQHELDTTPPEEASVVIVERLYAVVHDCISKLTSRPLAWFLLRQLVVVHVAEDALLQAFKELKISEETLRADLIEAARKDNRDILGRLKHLGGNDENIAEILEEGACYGRKELTTAFMRHVDTLEPTTEEDNEFHEFLRNIALVFRRLSGRSDEYELPSWCLTSFEVDFDGDGSHIIGRGAYGRILKGDWNGQIVAIKEMSSRLNDEKAIESIRHEVKVWSQLSHLNILPFYGACLDTPKPFIVSKLCNNGNALKFLSSFPGTDRIRLLHDVSIGVAYLHSRGIIHADLKGSNILIGDHGEALLADFGLSHIQDQTSPSINATRFSADRVGGTLRWMAPEVLEGKGLNKSADIYGFALTAWEFYSRGAVPFSNVVDVKLFIALIKKGERPERPPGIENGVWRLIQRCWRPDPSERPDCLSVESRLSSFTLRADRINSRSSTPDSFQGVRVSSIPKNENLSTLIREPEIKGDLPSLGLPKPKTNPESGYSFFKSLANKRILSFSKSLRAASHDSESKDIDKGGHVLNDKWIMSYASTIPSLSRTAADKISPTRQMDLILAYLYNISLTTTGVSEILSGQNLVQALITRLLWPELLESERYLTVGILANLGCRAKARSILLAQADLLSALTISLAPSSSLSIQENVTRCLYNLSTNGESHPLIVGQHKIMLAFTHILFSRSSTNSVTNVLGCLTNISHKASGRSAILSKSETIAALTQIPTSNASDRAKEQALMCLGNLSVDEKSVDALILQPDLISHLAMCLSQPPTSPIKSQALRCLRNLSASPKSLDSIISHHNIMTTLSEIISARASSNQQRYSLHLLHRLTMIDAGKQWLEQEPKCLESLQWFVENGSFEEQSHANSCLGVVE